MHSTRFETLSDSPAVLTTIAEYREAVRRRIVWLVFLVYWLLVFEGVLRKWVAPDQERILFFIRDPFVLWIYWLAIRHRVWPMASPYLTLGTIFAGTALVLIPLQLLIGDYDLRYLLLGGYGWRNYFFYLPLAFIIGEQFRWRDLERLTRHTMIVAVPAALLVATQFSAPANAMVNLGSSLDEAHQFRTLGFAFNIIRPTGFFSSSFGQSNFIASLFALLLSAWLAPQAKRAVSLPLLWVATVATASMLALSGSRGLMFQVAIVFASAVALVLFSRAQGTVIRAWVLPTLFILAGLILFPVLFPMAHDAFVQRWQDAYQVESHIYSGGVWGRVIAGFYKFLVVIPQAPSLGHMLGMGANAAKRLEWVELPLVEQPAWLGGGVGFEDPWTSHILELGPFLGVLFILFRISFTVWLGIRCVKATRLWGDPLPLLLFGYVGALLLYSFITAQGSLVGYAWLFAGFCMAATRLDSSGYAAKGVTPDS